MKRYRRFTKENLMLFIHGGTVLICQPGCSPHVVAMVMSYRTHISCENQDSISSQSGGGNRRVGRRVDHLSVTI